jgi:signal transduction histidine kinase
LGNRDDREQAAGADHFGLVLSSIFLLLALLTAAVFLLPGLYFAVFDPLTDTILNTAATVAAGAVAAFGWIRYRHSGRNDALLQSSAFLTLFLAGALRATVLVAGPEIYPGFHVDTAGQAPLYSWTFARLVAGALLVAGAISTIRNWEPPTWRAVFILWLGPLATLVYSLAVLSFEQSLPVLLSPASLRGLVGQGNVLDLGLISLPLLVVELFIAAIFLAGAAAYRQARQGGHRDTYTRLLSVSLLFAAFSQVHFAIVPGAYSDLLTSGDLLRLAFYLLILAAVAAAIRDDLIDLRSANLELQRLRHADAARITAEERARLARDVHDGLVQELWLARLTGGRLVELPRMPRDARELLRRLDVTLETAQAEARQALITLQARADVGFGDLMRRFIDDYADRFDMDISRDVDLSVSPPHEVQTELIRICREALNNVRKHADASSVTVRLTEVGDQLRLEVADNGQGFDASASAGSGFGMESMRQRAAKIHGRLDVRSAPMDGTTVLVEVRLPQSEAGQ